MSRIAVVGSLSRDTVAGAPPRPGGAAFYAGRALARLGLDAEIVTRCGAKDAHWLLPPLESFGLPVTFREGERTTGFSFHYEGDHRVMQVDEVGDPWTAGDVTAWVDDALRDTHWVQVGALLRTDFDAGGLAQLGLGRHLLIDAQGLVRVAEVGPLQRDAHVDAAALASITILKLNEDEARVLAGGVDVDLIRRLRIPEVVVTLGSAGALVVTESAFERIPAVVIDEIIDPTGAGDSFSAAYLHARSQDAAPIEAARFANDAAAELLRAPPG